MQTVKYAFIPNTSLGTNETYGEFVKFTMIELLVVLSIITILGSLLLPVLITTQEKSRSINCTANLKQVTTGTMIYTNEFNGYFPSRATAKCHWASALVVRTSILPNYSVAVCPSYPPYKASRGKEDMYQPYLTYGILGIYDPDDAITAVNYLSLKKMHTLAKTEIFGDSVNITPSSWVSEQGFSPGPVQYAFVRKNFSTSHSTAIHLRHFVRANFAWADGHVAPVNANSEIVSAAHLRALGQKTVAQGYTLMK